MIARGLHAKTAALLAKRNLTKYDLAEAAGCGEYSAQRTLVTIYNKGQAHIVGEKDGAPVYAAGPGDRVIVNPAVDYRPFYFFKEDRHA